jgi:hypothetical protein
VQLTILFYMCNINVSGIYVGHLFSSHPHTLLVFAYNSSPDTSRKFRSLDDYVKEKIPILKKFTKLKIYAIKFIILMWYACVCLV